MGQKHKSATGFHVVGRFGPLEIAILGEKRTGLTYVTAQRESISIPQTGLFLQGRHDRQIETSPIHQPLHDLRTPAGQVFLFALFKKSAIGATDVRMTMIFGHVFL
jgi:hypothetical protein